METQQMVSAKKMSLQLDYIFFLHVLRSPDIVKCWVIFHMCVSAQGNEYNGLINIQVDVLKAECWSHVSVFYLPPGHLNKDDWTTCETALELLQCTADNLKRY